MSNERNPANYPQAWEEFIGQVEAVEQLQTRCAAALARGKPLDHVLIASKVSGAGKTSLAQLIAMTLGAPARIHTEPIQPRSVPFLMDELRRDGVRVLFLDEIHKQFDGGKRHAEWLLTFLEKGKIPTGYGLEDAPAITVIGATTDVGALTDPFLRRFRIKPTIVPYTDEEAALIAAQLARKILVSEGLAEPTPEVCVTIARAADNNPGEAENVLMALRDLVFAGKVEVRGGAYDVAKAIHYAGLTLDGLTSREIAYLKLLVQSRGRPLGRQTVKELLGEVANGVGYLDERLHAKGLIVLGDRGRELTPEGRRRAQELAAAA